MQEERKPVFNALNGVELRKYILDQIEKKLEASNEFPEGLTFPWVKWRLGILSYPQQDKNAEPKNEFIEESGEIPEGSSEGSKEIVIDLEEIVDTPDKARVESNQPVPTPLPGPGLGMRDGKGFGPLSPPVTVDKPVVAKKGK
jgi:hypothetical protein